MHMYGREMMGEYARTLISSHDEMLKHHGHMLYKLIVFSTKFWLPIALFSSLPDLYKQDLDKLWFSTLSNKLLNLLLSEFPLVRTS